MIRSLWISKTGLESQQFNVDTIANNLANVTTNGFKRQVPVFADLLYATLRQPGAQTTQLTQYPTGMQVGSGAAPVATVRIFTEGALEHTGNSLDLAINGKGFFQILLPDGTLAYTRDGSFQLDSNGQIVTPSGYQLQPTISVPQDATSITIGTDGTVSVTTPNSPNATQIGNIQLADFINPAGLQSEGNNLYVETSASGPPTVNDPGTNGLGTLDQGYVETSNVSVTEELVDLITAQRAFEINSRAVRTSDEMLARLAQL